MGSRGPPQKHPNSEVSTKSYNFTTTWEQVILVDLVFFLPSSFKSDQIRSDLTNSSLFLWRQNAPLTDQQQNAITSLSHSVSERPFPLNLAVFTFSTPFHSNFCFSSLRLLCICRHKRMHLFRIMHCLLPSRILLLMIPVLLKLLWLILIKYVFVDFKCFSHIFI